ncbi:Substrate-binding domain cholesterol oxidase [Ceratobasidium theobromae]|uniref:Substrate-binding domain cholesterol oxidase n=1 Tax=Ceratobasidium theobromae TaxID=1582974 RepID=A0A5N5QET7_9AGAM|nr:Substrate-binding domain cholesterol oxidase [Ceratobasidium theobromae]
MAQPITCLPDTTPTSTDLEHDVALKDLIDAITNLGAHKHAGELKPLLPILQGEISDDDDEAHATFASMFKAIQAIPEFEKIFDDDVPNAVKKVLEEYAFPKEQVNVPRGTLEANFSFAPPAVLKSGSILSAIEGLATHVEPSWEPLANEMYPPSVAPLPLSPDFHRMAQAIVDNLEEFKEILEGDGKPMERVKLDEAKVFMNWGKTVYNRPEYTFVARTEVGLCNLVKWARDKGKKVRVAGYRHSWTDLYSSDGEVLVMLLPFKALTDTSAYSPSVQEIQKSSDLVGIEEGRLSTGTIGTLEIPESNLCTIKAGTTNDMFRAWCLERRRWCLPFNIVMVEITLGGSNATICHGSGFSTRTLSDLVAEFHYIDPNGDPKSISDPEQLRAASGCFGLLGICTAVTLRLDAMTMAVMNPVKVPLPLAIPPPPGYKIPSAIDMRGITVDQLNKAQEDFVKRCKEDYYLEWFWFPLTKEVWINTWKKADPGAAITSLQPYPSAVEALIQWGEGWAAEKLINSWAFQHLLSPKDQTLLLAKTALFTMPNIPDPKNAIKTLLSEALHFRRGVQNVRCYDSEWEIPIPAAPNAPAERDYSVIQRAWWDAISIFYSRGDVPMQLTLEMRLTGDSNVILAPQRGNDLGTISIEVLTVPTTPDAKKRWQSFVQQVVKEWTSYTDSNGTLLNSRPHWAKEWQGLTVRDQPVEEYLKHTAYKEAIPEFREALEKIAAVQGTTVDEMRKRFGNPLLERLFFSP